MADKYFVDSDKTKRHVIDEDFISLLPLGLTEISRDEYDELVAASQLKSDAAKLSEFKALVQSALDASDLVALRAYKAGINFGEEWGAYDQKLRALMAVTEWHGDLALPPQPISYPS